MPVARGFLRQSGDGSIKSFVIILTAIGLLFFVYYKFKSSQFSQLCADQVSDIGHLKMEVSRLKGTIKTCFDEVVQKKNENAKLFNQDDTKNQDLENARKDAVDKIHELAQVKDELQTANKKLKNCHDTEKLDSNDGTCSDIKEIYEKQIAELKQQLQASKGITPYSGVDRLYDQKDDTSNEAAKTDKNGDEPKMNEFNKKENLLPKKEIQAYDNDDEVEKKDESNINKQKLQIEKDNLPKKEIQVYDNDDEVEKKDVPNFIKEKHQFHESNSFSGLNRSKDVNNEFANKTNNDNVPHKKQTEKDRVFPQHNNFGKIENKNENYERKDSVERMNPVFNITHMSKAGNLSDWARKKLEESGSNYKNQVEKVVDINQQHFDEIVRSDKKKESSMNAVDGGASDLQDNKNSLPEQEVPHLQLNKKKKSTRFEGSIIDKMEDKREDHPSDNFSTKGRLMWNNRKPAADSIGGFNNHNQDPWKQQEPSLKRYHASSDTHFYRQKSSMTESAVRDLPSDKNEKELS